MDKKVIEFIACVVLLVILFASCREKGAKNGSAQQSHGAQLNESGYLKYADEKDKAKMEQELVDSFVIYDPASYKIAHIDAEELCEFSFEFFMPELTAMLSKRNFTLTAVPAKDYQASNEALINGVKVQLYTQADMVNETYWDIGPRMFFKEVNRQLKDKKIDEAFYLLYGGNDLHVLLLTPKQYAIIAEHHKDNPKELPELP